MPSEEFKFNSLIRDGGAGNAAQTALLNSQQNAVSFRKQQMVASVQLIKALGGGWDANTLAAKP